MGLNWRIGDGSTVWIWHDKWLPTPTAFAVQSPCTRLDAGAKVEELMDKDLGGWNTKLIQEIFNTSEAETICSIPLSRYSHSYKMIWRSTNAGLFTIRSAYYMEKERINSLKGEGSSRSGYTHVWKAVWSLQVPNATMVFLWRACADILPMKEKLLQRRVVDEDLCIFCEREQETMMHILWECPSSTDVWSACDRRIQKTQAQNITFLDVVDSLLLRCNGEEMNLFALIANRIWA